MKADAFKKLIKEAVREVLREELADVLTEAPKRQVSHITKYAPYTPPVHKPKISTGDPIMDLLEETKASMLRDPNAGHYMDMSQYAQAPGLGESTYSPVMMEENFTRQEPGLDISQFDFVKNAAAVFKASQEKDKQRFGG
jgi:hypothetical protein